MKTWKKMIGEKKLDHQLTWLLSFSGCKATSIQKNFTKSYEGVLKDFLRKILL